MVVVVGIVVVEVDDADVVVLVVVVVGVVVVVVVVVRVVNGSGVIVVDVVIVVGTVGSTGAAAFGEDASTGALVEKTFVFSWCSNGSSSFGSYWLWCVVTALSVDNEFDPGWSATILPPTSGTLAHTSMASLS